MKDILKNGRYHVEHAQCEWIYIYVNIYLETSSMVQ